MTAVDATAVQVDEVEELPVEGLRRLMAGARETVRELLRFVRLSRGGDPGYAFTWPDRLR